MSVFDLTDAETLADTAGLTTGTLCTIKGESFAGIVQTMLGKVIAVPTFNDPLVREHKGHPTVVLYTTVANEQAIYCSLYGLLESGDVPVEEAVEAVSSFFHNAGFDLAIRQMEPNATSTTITNDLQQIVCEGFDVQMVAVDHLSDSEWAELVEYASKEDFALLVAAQH